MDYFKSLLLFSLVGFLSADCPTASGPCPENWSYQSVSNACYFLKNFTASNGKTWDVVDVNEAELRCRQLNPKGRLVSIHDALENQIVFDFLKTTNLMASTMAPAGSNPCSSAYSWCGLSYTKATDSFAWTDGSKADWIPPVYKLSGITYYGMSSDESCGGTKIWGSYSTEAAQLLARYICKIAL
ncbi:unnamed protein product, partial [Mesorhabditis belari]|uniref:C-type lectin domain-containing protein n=1 Tax=Mesorhabditis belari TaxID=2138241 RepID=A0AAF3FHE9_9BILA